MTTIPASELVAVTPSVISAGGAGLALSGLFLTRNARPPIGSVLSFPNAAAVGSFFGAGSPQAVNAENYFSGFVGATQTPGAMLWAQYNDAAVSAYVRGGNISALPLATLQGYSGTLNVTIDGVLKSASVNLSAATSFSNAAEIIANALGIIGVVAGTVTGSIGGTATTSTTTGTTLTLGALATGTLQVGDVLSGTDGTHTLSTQTIVAQLTGTPGGSAGATFQMSAAGTGGDLSSFTVTAKGKTLAVTALGTAPAVSVANVISGTGITAGTYVTAQVTPLISGEALGGVGRYAINATQGGVVVGETITLDTPAVQYDSVSGAFTITSGTTGTASTITYADGGAIAGQLLLTQATGAVLSQGAAPNTAATVSAFMNGVVSQTMNWATFTTHFDPDNGSGSTVKQAFAAWKNAQNNRFGYVPFDNDPTPATSLPATASLGYLLENSNDSGTFAQWTPDATSGTAQAAFVMGSVASINFNQAGGRVTFAFKSQAGLAATVTTATAAQNLLGNFYNFYGAYGAANQNFVWEQDGQCTGPFNWFDSYVNQIWLNNNCQQSLLGLLGTMLSIPFSQAGASLIRETLATPIAAGLSFGAFAPGTISPTEIAEVNAAAGASVAGTLQSQGWYLVVAQQSSAVRKTRGPWNITLFYLDRGSVQSINLSSVLVQ